MSGTTDLVPIETLKPAEVFAPGGVEKLLVKVETDVRAMTFDASTDAGRGEIKSIAYKIARSKTALDDMGKNFVADLKRAAGVVDADRRIVRDRFDALRDEVRKPVDEWEAAEELRIANLVAALDALKDLDQFGMEPSVEAIDERLAAVALARTRDWQEFNERAEQLLGRVPASLTAMRETAVRRDAERAELERLRKAEADRLEADRVARLAREQQEHDEKIAAEAAAKAEQERADAIARAVKAESDAKAAAEKSERDRLLAAEQAEQDRQAAIVAERKRLADARAAEDAETAKRSADQKHCREINRTAAADLVREAAISEDIARAVVIAIARGKIANIKIQY